MTAGYGSDVVVDALRAFGVPYVTLNPGASFRGLHDSLVNYDTGIRLNVPTAHPLNVTGTRALDDADVILLVDVRDVGQHAGLLTKGQRGRNPGEDTR